MWALLCTALLMLLAGALIAVRWSTHPPVSYQQLTFRRGAIWSARFAADGQNIIYAASWAGKPLEIFLRPPGSTESQSLALQNAELLAVSRTGEMAVLLNSRQVAHFVSRGTLARVSLGGGAPREILDDVQQADWSGDGSKLAIIHDIGTVERLEYPIGKTLCETSGWISYPRISPKGDRVAFMEHQDRWDDRGRISVVDLNGHKEVLSEEWASEHGLAWSPDGKEVWFTANRSGEAYGLYAVNQKKQERVLARVPSDLMLHDVAPNGDVLLSSETYSTPVMALAPGQTTERDISELDGVSIYELSNDGKTFVFQYYGEGSGTNYASYLGKTDGSPSVRLGEGAAIALSPDGKWVISILNQPRQTVLMPTGSGETRVLDRSGLREFGDDHWTPDGKHVVFSGQEDGKPSRSFIQDIEGGRPRPLTPEGITGTLISPNGQFLLTNVSNGKRSLFYIPQGSLREIRGLRRDDQILRWSEDGWLLCVSGGHPPFTIYALDPITGNRRVVRSIAPPDSAGTGTPHLHLSADGKSYVYAFQRVLSKLYLVKGVQ
jgi:Tol biopolymer transport system component